MTTTNHPRVLAEWLHTRQEMLRASGSECADSRYSQTANAVAQFKHEIATSKEGMEIDR